MLENIMAQAYRIATQHHQAGRLNEAEKLYRQVLQAHPHHPESLHLMGVLSAQQKRPEAAVEFLRKAVAACPAEPTYHANLGSALLRKGDTEQAIASYRAAVRLKPDYADAYNNLGGIYKTTRQIPEAIASFGEALRHAPDHFRAHNNLGVVLLMDQQFTESEAACRTALRLKPDYAEAHYNLGNALKAQGQLLEAVEAYRRAMGIKKEFVDACMNLGVVLIGLSRFTEAIAALREAVRLRPDHAIAHHHLGDAFHATGELEGAITSYNNALRIRPDLAETHFHLGHALRAGRRSDEAIAAYRAVIGLAPDHAESYRHLGMELLYSGAQEEAIAALRHAVELKPGDAAFHSSLVLALNYCSSDPEPPYAEARRWASRHADPLKAFTEPHTNNRDANRRLRIGYVSADFRAHVCALFIDPLLSAHHSSDVEIYCYAQVPRPDSVTQRFQKLAHYWRSTAGQSDEAVAAMIRRDQIDILVDLKVHSDDHRLLVFARKPAPVQVTWLGYPGTTGMSAIDYRLSDPYIDPPGHEGPSAEAVVRLPETFWCYDPQALPSLDTPLPALANGYITFGCLNNFSKINDGVVQLWSKVLAAVPGSQMMLLAGEGGARRHIIERMEQLGIVSDRLVCVKRSQRAEYLNYYHRIDIGLDVFPYNGHTTSLDSFWMGVPVITLAGKTPVGRGGVSQLMNLGLAELIAETPEQYVRIAAELAGDLPGLAALRGTLRSRMEKSPLMDADRFARNIEAAYRAMWKKWCDGGGDVPDSA